MRRSWCCVDLRAAVGTRAPQDRSTRNTPAAIVSEVAARVCKSTHVSSALRATRGDSAATNLPAVAAPVAAPESPEVAVESGFVATPWYRSSHHALPAAAAAVVVEMEGWIYRADFAELLAGSIAA